MYERVQYLEENQKAVLRDLLYKHRKTKSGVEIDVNPDGTALWLKSPLPGEGAKHFFDGAGITDRELPEYEEYLPGIAETLMTTKGRIAFLGNGLSNVPLTTAVSRYENGELGEQPVIVDVFDYQALGEDLHAFLQDLWSNNLDLTTFTGNHATHILDTLDGINDAVSKGNLKTVVYCVGAGSPPEDIKDLSLAVSYCGPATSSMREQLSLLKPGGSIYSESYHRPNRLRYTTELLGVGVKIIKRESLIRRLR